jgi:TM2 domain-containing membrane protein YozV
LGNFVTTEDEKGNNRFYLYSPSAGGQKINFNDNTIIVITPSSPFGKVLLGKKVNEEINLGIKQKIILIQ